VKEIAVTQRGHAQDVYDDIPQAGMMILQGRSQYAVTWDTLSQRKQQVATHTCVGYRSYEIADALGISYDTVRTHSKHVYAKFGLNRKEVRLALHDWGFCEWLEGLDSTKG
jgi:DNA-binding CsgD family transcriptional regulator